MRTPDRSERTPIGNAWNEYTKLELEAGTPVALRLSGGLWALNITPSGGSVSVEMTNTDPTLVDEDGTGGHWSTLENSPFSAAAYLSSELPVTGLRLTASAGATVTVLCRG